MINTKLKLNNLEGRHLVNLWEVRVNNIKINFKYIVAPSYPVFGPEELSCD